MPSARSRLTPSIAVLALWSAGCAGLRLPGPDSLPDAPAAEALPDRALRVAIAVEEVPAEDAWRVYYSLGAPALGVEFLGGLPGPLLDERAFRRERWGAAVARGEGTWRLEGGRERLCFSRPAGSFSVSFRTWAGWGPPAGMADEGRGLNVAMSDGSRLLDTGPLLVRPLASCGEGTAPPPGDPVFRFTFGTAAERIVRLPGLAAAGELRWEPDPGEAGTWVYFGGLEAVAGEAATVILDPGLPGWLRADMAATVPRLVARLGAAATPAATLRPLVLVAWGGDGGGPGESGASLATDTRPGLLLAAARGPGWAEETPEARRAWLHRLAREAFLLWEREAVPARGVAHEGGEGDEEPGWLAEAAAGQFAAEAMVAFGAEEVTEARRRLVARANDCLVRLGGRSLPAAAEGDPEAWSSCGAVAMAAADCALRRGASPSGLTALFRRLFEHAAATGGYDARAFLGGLRELGAEAAAVADLRRLVLGDGAPQGDRFLERLLAHAGVAVERVPPADATADPKTLEEMVARAVGRCYCGTGEAASCDPATTGRQVASLAGEPIAPDPLGAWDRLRTAIARGSALPVDLAGEEVTLFCSHDAFDPTWESLLKPL